ncbi:hypothetical protein ACOZ4N_03110 [Halorientalis pallida]|uniref:hypothetical protein n=1 Tax=Halorientalis pallida TaxID=2479928 RepID=UPI003C6FD8E4
MVGQSLHRAAVDRFGPETTEYGWLLAVLLGTLLSRTVVGGVVDRLDALPPRLLDPHLLGTVVYATAGTVVVVTLAAVFLRLAEPDVAIRPADTVRLPLLTWGVLAVGAYVLLGTVDIEPFPASVVELFFGTVVPMGLLAVAYARRRGVEISLSIPGVAAGPILGPAIVLAAIAGGVPPFAASVLSGGFPGPGGFYFGPPPLTTLLVTAVLTPVLVGGAYGLLFNGVIQASLRERFGAVGAVAVVTALVATFRLAAVPFPFDGPLFVLTTVAAGAVLPVLAAVLAVEGIASVGAVSVEPEARELALVLGVTAAVVLIAVGAFWALVLGALFGPDAISAALGIVLSAPAYLAVAAIASVSYERVRSVWVPAVVFAVFLAALDVGPYLARAI